MSINESFVTPVQRRAQAFRFAEVIQAARHGLQLSVDEAADLVGLPYFMWLEVESGEWIPEDFHLVKDMAAVLEINHIFLVFLAEMSRFSRTELDKLSA